jgi:hypothetical protein
MNTENLALRTLLPKQIRDDLTQVLAPLRSKLSPGLRGECDALMDLLLPPPDLAAIAWAVKRFLLLRPAGFEALQPAATALEQILRTKFSGPLPRLSRSKSLGTRYPVFFALGRFVDSLPQLDPLANTSVITGLFLKLCKKAHDTKELRPSVYYFNVLLARDVLIDGYLKLGLGRADSRSVEALCDAVIENARKLIARSRDQGREATPLAGLPKNALTKLKRIIELVEGVREFGRPVFFDGRPGPGSGPRQRSELGAPQRIRLTETPIVAASLTSEGEADLLPNGAECDVVVNVKIPENPRSPRTEDPVVTKTELTRRRRKGGSCLAPKDDKRAARARIDGIQARSVVGYTDASRLPLPIIVRFLDYLFTNFPLAFCFAWICFTTALAPKELERAQLVLGRHSRKGSEVILDARRGILNYVLAGGPTDFGQNSKHRPSESHIVRTPIPLQLVEILRKQPHEPDMLLFQGMDRTLGSLASRFWKHTPGLPPTGLRLVRSFWLHMPPLGLRNVGAAFTAGEVPTRFGAHTDYYRLARHDLHVRYSSAVRQLAQSLAAHPLLSPGLREWARDLTFRLPPPAPDTRARDAYVGSQVATDLEKLVTFFQKTREAMEHYHQRIALTLPADRGPLIAEALNLANLQHYVLQEFLGVRPRGDIAIVSYSDPRYGALIEDKGSAQYREFSSSPLFTVLISQANACRDSMTRVTDYCRRHRISLVDNRRAGTDLMAAAFHYRRAPAADGDNRAMFVAVTMTSARYRTMLHALGLGRFCPIEYNELRHSILSHFHEKVPLPALAQWGGHHLPGYDILAPWSSSKISSYFEELKEVERYLAALNPSVLSLPEAL